MLDTKLIIVTGSCGTGKSTTAKWLGEALQMNGIDCYYLHEECQDHPIRGQEFSYGSVTNAADMDVNCSLMLDLWAQHRDDILADGRLEVLEACLYENIIRYFFECNYPENQILSFYQDLMEILEPLHPVIIHLRTRDMFSTLQQAFKTRGDRWRDLILKDRCKYYVEHGFEGDEGNYRLFEDYQSLAIQAYDRYQGPKLWLDTLAQDWDSYHKDICEFLGLEYFPPAAVIEYDPEDFTGRYETLINEKQCGFNIFYEDGQLYCRSFWPYMALESCGGDAFRFFSFPIHLQFMRSQGKVYSVKVSGNYDWGLCGLELERIDTKVH